MKTWMRALLLLTPFIFSCASDDGVVVVNTPPTITWTFDSIAVGKRWDVTLMVTIADPDADDNLTTTWSVTRGTLSPQGAYDTQLGWRAPSTMGTDTVVVTVSDGTDTDRVEAEIIVGTGLLNANLPSTLRLVDSPYVLKPDGGIALVGVGGNTVVEAGVLVYAQGGGSIQVEGTLTANGTADKPVFIRANDWGVDCASGPEWWEGIRAQGAAGFVNLTHTRIWHAEKAVSLPVGNSGSARLTACELQCSNVGAEISSAGWLVVDSCLIDNNLNIGVYVKSGSQRPDSVAIRDSNISINGNTGIMIDAPGFNTPVAIRRNHMEANFTYGIRLTGESAPIIEFNHFESNGLSGGLRNIYLDLGYPGDMTPPAPSPTLPWLAADNNYWGFVPPDSITIRTTIRDREDEPTAIGTYVYVTDWLDVSPAP